MASGSECVTAAAPPTSHTENGLTLSNADIGLTAAEDELALSKTRFWHETREKSLPSFAADGVNGFPCDQCGTVFARNCRLKLHKRIHTGEKPYKCQECGAAFNQSGSLKRHTRIHTGEKPYACEFCDARFAEKGNLNDHVRFHTGEKRYKCPECGELFATRARLYSHLQAHTDRQKPYQCMYCEAAFSQRKNLYLHCRIHADEKIVQTFPTQQENLQPIVRVANTFKCDHCDASFTENAQLNSHVKQTHDVKKPYKCQHCDARFSDKENLQEHSATHLPDDKKPYQCNICGSAFTQQIDLQNHVRIHSRIHRSKKAFMCEICGAVFSQIGALERHAQTRHSNCDSMSNSYAESESCVKDKLSIDSDFLQKWSTIQFGLASCASRWRIPNFLSEHYLSPAAASTSSSRQLNVSSGFRVSSNIEQRSEFVASNNAVLRETAAESIAAQKKASNGEITTNKMKLQTTPCQANSILLSYLRPQNEFGVHETKPTSVVDKVVTESRRNCAEVIRVPESRESVPSLEKVEFRKEINVQSVQPNFVKDRRTRSKRGRKRSRRGQVFQCKECGSTFALQCRLKLHARIHTGEKPYVCKECGAAFNQSGTLRRHAVVHTRHK